MTTITMSELETQSVELLPEKETLWFNANYANVYASNSSLALNAATLLSSASATSYQVVAISQS
jgi:hypothetical protein